MCEECGECGKDHVVTSARESAQLLRDRLESEFPEQSEAVRVGLGRRREVLMDERDGEVSRGRELVAEIRTRVLMLTAALQAREQELCEQIAQVRDRNTYQISQCVKQIDGSLASISSFNNVCRGIQGIPVDNALLQLQPLLEARLFSLTRQPHLPNPRLDTISWTDHRAGEIRELCGEFGSVTVGSKSGSEVKVKRTWEKSFHTPMSLCGAGETLLVIESAIVSRKQKCRVKEYTREGEVVKEIWACSRTCSEVGKLVVPVVASDGKGTLAVGMAHEIILVNTATKKSCKFGKHGRFPGQMRSISSLAFSSVGNILVADDVLSRVSMFEADGDFILCFGTLGRPGATGPHSLDRPSSIAVDSRDRVLVADTGNNRVAVYNHEGCFIKAIGGKGGSTFSSPTHVAIDEGGEVLGVLDAGRVQLFSMADYSVIATLDLSAIHLPRCVVFGESALDLLVSDQKNIHRFSILIDLQN